MKKRFVDVFYKGMETGVIKLVPQDNVWNRWSDQPLYGTFEIDVHTAKFLPSVWLKQLTETGKGLK